MNHQAVGLPCMRKAARPEIIMVVISDLAALCFGGNRTL
jgi:hypothetical protein